MRQSNELFLGGLNECALYNRPLDGSKVSSLGTIVGWGRFEEEGDVYATSARFENKVQNKHLAWCYSPIRRS